MPTRPHRKLFLPFSADPAAAALTIESLQANPLVPGVSAIACGPAKGHSYFDEANAQMVPVWVDATTLQSVLAACGVYSGGLRVNAGHFTEIREAAGRLTAFRVDGAKLRADFELFRSYQGFDHLCEIIVKIPDTFGLSIDFDGSAEVIDGKAFPRVTEIYSCDLVATPAANEGGLFNAGRRGKALDHLRHLFDSANQPMPNPAKKLRVRLDDGTEVDATVVTPTADPVLPTDIDARIRDAVAAALGDALTRLAAAEATVSQLNAAVPALTQRVATLEASLTADDGTSDIPTDDAATPAAMRAARSFQRQRRTFHAEVKSLAGEFKDLREKLGRRMGIEFAARAGANPLENPTSGNEGGGSDQRKSFEIPTSEANQSAAVALLGLK